MSDGPPSRSPPGANIITVFLLRPGLTDQTRLEYRYPRRGVDYQFACATRWRLSARLELNSSHRDVTKERGKSYADSFASVPLPFARINGFGGPLGNCSMCGGSIGARQLLTVAVQTPINTTVVSPGAAASNIDLSSAFNDPAVTLVDFTTNEGPIDLSLTPQATPKTVADFLRYVNAGLYNGTIVHRSVPGFVIQGGGFTTTGASVPTFAPVVNEFSPSRPNVTGTIAMAKTSDPNSATDQWFINLADNSQSLDNTANSGGFTVFGSVINNTLSTADTIAALPTVDGSALNSQFGTSLPVLNASTAITDPSNLVTVSSAQVVPDTSLFTLSATSNNPSLVSPTISGNTLTLAYPSGAATGVADITVTAAEAGGGTATQTFVVGVGALPITLSAAGSKSVAFTDAGGHRDVATLSGPGSATVTFVGTGLTQGGTAKKIVVNGSGAAVAGIATTGTTAKRR